LAKAGFSSTALYLEESLQEQSPAEKSIIHDAAEPERDEEKLNLIFPTVFSFVI
jgi:hypothetical protein